MKISLCIPQYNRIRYLLKNLAVIAQQTYHDIEVAISDDASTDNTQEEIEKLQKVYRFPLHYYKHPVNVGYDANLRKSLELATGDYCLMMGNDDTLYAPDAIEKLVQFLTENGLPELGFCNYAEDHSPNTVIARASATKVVGTGEAVALKYYRSFSYVAGIIMRKDVFDTVNTNKVDGSVYVQMYFAARVITTGGRFFMYEQPLILKDIRIDGSMANSYRDTLMRSWKDYKPIDGGFKQVVHAVVEGFKDAGSDARLVTYKVLKNIYRFSYTYWLLDYRSNGSFISAYAMMRGIKPSGMPHLKNLSLLQRLKIRGYYYSSSAIGLLTPVVLFQKMKLKIHKLIKR